MMKSFLGAVVAFCLICGFGPQLRAQNIVTNGGFETGDLSGWTNIALAWSIDTSDPQTGTYDAKNGCVGAACLDPVNGSYIYQSLPTVIGGTYNLSFWVDWIPLEGGQSPASGPVTSGEPQSNGEELDVYWNGSLVPVSAIMGDDAGVYTQYTVSNLLATSGSTVLQFNAEDDPSYVALDSIDVESATPEPASLLLIAIALLGLGVMAARRKAERRSN